MPSLIPNARQQFLSEQGAPLAGGSVYTYIPGTTTPKTTYLDPQGQNPNTNPVILDAAGTAAIFGTGLYRQQVYDASGNLIWDAETGLPYASDLTTGQVLTLSSNTVLTAAQSGTAIVSNGTSPATYTLPAPSAGLSFLIFGSPSATVTVAAPSGTTLFLPDGSAPGSVSLPSSQGGGVVVFGDGANWRGRPFGQEVVAAAVAANQAVALGQLQNASLNLTTKNATAANQTPSFSQTIGGGAGYVNQAANRVLGATYTNNSARPMAVQVSILVTTAGNFIGTIDGGQMIGVTFPTGYNQLSFIVPPGTSYNISAATGAGSVNQWYEY